MSFKFYRLFARELSLFFVFLLMIGILQPLTVLGNTGGGSQPEFGSFMDAGNMQLVDPFTGDFSYNIPLLSVSGYPINLSYSAGITMEQQASWVGLGWNINPGAISRSVRGVPDDFDGDEITEVYSIKKKYSWGADFGVGGDLAGFKVKIPKVFGDDVKLSASRSLNYSDDRGVFLSGQSGLSTKYWSINGGYSPASGFSLTPGLSSNDLFGDFSAGISGKFNSRNGFQGIGINASYTKTEQDVTNKKGKTVDRQTSLSGSSFYPYNEISYFPYSKPKLKSTSVDLNFKFGLDVMPAGMYATVGGRFSVEQPINGDISRTDKAYGYLYLHEKEDKDLGDFNRDGDYGVFYPDMEFLPPSQMTFDIYTVQGQGLSGQVRPYRTRTQFVSDPEFKVSVAKGASASFELGTTGPTGNESGFDLGGTESLYKVTSWLSSSENAERFKFRGNENGTLEQEVFFAEVGEMRNLNDYFINAVNTTKPLAIDPNKIETDDEAEIDKFTKSFQFTNAKSPREKHKKAYIFLSAQNAKIKRNATKEVEIYSANLNGINTGHQAFDRVNTLRKESHISEINVTDEKGDRYVFGLPAYNIETIEKTFSVAGNSQNTSSLIAYIPGADDTENNNKGKDNFYSSKKIPGQAHSYLLTEYLGSDYVDINSDGVSDDDLGFYVKFNYSQLSDDYHWRVPVEFGMANHIKGSIYSEEDDKASYTYGTKEQYILHSIESKDEIAFFILNDGNDLRKDGYGVSGINGLIVPTAPGQQLRSLKEIRLYNKADWNTNSSNAVPIKVVKFEYTNELCKGTPNTQPNTEGKLTLKSVSINNRLSTVGEESKYSFTYNNNPDYNKDYVDRWGSYNANNPTGLSNSEFPFANENIAQSDLAAGAWNLSQIQLPSGGTISIQYEADRYQYVQDQLACRMYQLKGVGFDDVYANASNILYKKKTADEGNEYLFFTAPPGIDNNNVEERLLPDDKEVYFSLFVNINDDVSSFERIEGYGKVEKIGVKDGYVYLKFEKVNFNEKGEKTGGLFKTVADYIVQNLQTLVIGNIEPDDSQLKKSFKSMTTILDDIFAMFTNQYELLKQKKLGDKIDNGKSWIRLLDAERERIGGGYRVKQVEFSDNMQDLASIPSQKYGYKYVYKTALIDGECSGVANYEPMLGAEENIHNIPYYYKTSDKQKGKPKPRLFQEKPGDLFAPSPSVGYSSVFVQNINYETQTADIPRSANTYTHHGFYTAKDFPWISEYTPINYSDNKGAPQPMILGYGEKKTLGWASQGWLFVQNDMHGKPKFEMNYVQDVGQELNLISSTNYYYKTNSKGKLDSKVSYVNEEGKIVYREIGKNVDFVVDNTEMQYNDWQVNTQVNFYAWAAPIPGGLPPILPSASDRIKNFKYIINTKIVEQKGIIDSIVYLQNGLKTKLVNEIYDNLSGDALVSSTSTEFDEESGRRDAEYSSTIPLRFVPEYKRMGLASQNLNYAGTVQDFLSIISKSDYDNLQQSQKEILKKIIYKGYLDALEFGIINTAIVGNKVQAGVFVEGDVVMSGTSLYHVSEVITREEMASIIQALGSTASNPLGQITYSGTVVTSTGQTPTDLGGACFEAMQNLISMGNTYLNYDGTNPLVNGGQHSTIEIFLNNPNLQSFYGLFDPNEFANFLHLKNVLSNGGNMTSKLAWAYGNQERYRLYHTILNCPELLAYLQNHVMYPNTIDFLKDLINDRQLFELFTLFSKYRNEMSIVVESTTVDPNEQQGNTGGGPNDPPATPPAPTINFMDCSEGEPVWYTTIATGNTDYYFKLNTLKEFLVNNAINTSQTAYSAYLQSFTQTYIDNLNSDIQTVSPFAVAPSWLELSQGQITGIVNDVLCGNLQIIRVIEATGNCGCGLDETVDLSGEEDFGNDGALDPDDLIEPSYSEIAIFTNKNGEIVNLNTITVRVIQSGNKNMLTAGFGVVKSLNSADYELKQGSGLTEGIIEANFIHYSDEWPTAYNYTVGSNYIPNPFLIGQRGLFRPKQTYIPKFERIYSSNANNRSDGLLENYVQLYDHSNNIYNDYTFNADAQAHWTFNESVLGYTKNGTPLDVVNPIGLHSVKMNGKNGKLLLESANATYSQLLHDNFESYAFGTLVSGDEYSYANELKNYQVSSSPIFSDYLVNFDSHTGETSFMLRGTIPLNSNLPLKLNQFQQKYSSITTQKSFVFKDLNEISANSFLSERDDYYVEGFKIIEGKYKFSIWAKSCTYTASNNNYTAPWDYEAPEAFISLYCKDVNNQNLQVYLNKTASSEMIDGWRQISFEFEVPSGTKQIEMIMDGATHGAYFDDFRITPLNSATKTYVYNVVTGNIVAILDENNYATFYKYDFEGKMNKIMVETASGKITVQEKQINNAK